MNTKTFADNVTRTALALVLIILLSGVFPMSSSCDTFQNTFHAGWNLFSFPFFPDNQLAEKLFNEPPPGWSFYEMKDGEMVQVTGDSVILPGRGYWAYFNEETTVSFQGVENENSEFAINLQRGWNLVGTPFNYFNRSDLEFNGQPLPDEVDLYFYDSFQKEYYVDENIHAWSAFWIKVPESGTLTMGNSVSRMLAKLSEDGNAAVFSDSLKVEDNWNKPRKISSTGVASSEIAECWNSDPQIIPLGDTIYDFLLSSTTADEDEAIDGYSISFNIEHLLEQPDGYSSADYNDLRCGKCDTQTGNWEMADSDYGPISFHNYEYSVSCEAGEPGTYAVVIDHRPEEATPLCGYSPLYLSCGDSIAKVSWEKNINNSLIGYIIYQCASYDPNSCTEIERVDKSITYVDYPAENGTKVCYAVAGDYSYSGEGDDMTDPKCTVPSEDIERCGGYPIVLVSPGNSSYIEASPVFIFIGTGSMDFYVLQMFDMETYSIVFEQSIEGEGIEGGDRQTYSTTYSGTRLQYDKRYIWYVTGYRNSGKKKQSPMWTFEFNAFFDCYMPYPPELIVPVNGSITNNPKPEFKWEEVYCSES